MNNVVERAKIKAARAKELRKDARFIRAIEWLSFLGLLRTNYAKPRRCKIKLQDLLFAAHIEPRVNELLPALLIELRDLLPFSTQRLPKDLHAVIEAFANEQALPPYKGASPRKYTEWLGTPAMKLAYKRLHPRSQPRLRKDSAKHFSELIRRRRIELGFTQVDFSKMFGTSLRALRDLEQDKTTVSIDRANEILAPLKLTLVAAEL